VIAAELRDEGMGVEGSRCEQAMGNFEDSTSSEQIVFSRFFKQNAGCHEEPTHQCEQRRRQCERGDTLPSSLATPRLRRLSGGAILARRTIGYGAAGRDPPPSAMRMAERKTGQSARAAPEDRVPS